MLKWAKGVHSQGTSASFAYGNQPRDAGLTMAALMATGNVPFEAKTPGMIESVGHSFRADWFDFIGQHSDVLLQQRRDAKAGIWYSSATRDFIDFPIGGEYGMFTQTSQPTPDPAWWANHPDDSAHIKPHLGSYRGLASVLMRHHIPFSVFTDPGSNAASLKSLEVLLLPNVSALSDKAAKRIRRYVTRGGVVIATGGMPGTHDEWGNVRTSSVLGSLFGFADNLDPFARPANVNRRVGSGRVIYRGDLDAGYVFAEGASSASAATLTATLGNLISSYTTEDFVLTNGDGIYVDSTEPAKSGVDLVLVNYSGLQQPLRSNAKTVAIDYRPPANRALSSATAYTPGGGTTGRLAVTDNGNGTYRIDANVDIVTLINLNFGDSVDELPPDDGTGRKPTNSEIVVDGELGDWNSIPSFGIDPVDASGPASVLDWRENSMTHDNNRYFLAYRFDRPVPLSWGMTMYIDTDTNDATGYRAGLPIGADFLLQASFLYRYSGSGDNWSWSFVGAIDVAVGGSTVEMGFPRNFLGNPDSIRLLWVGDNSAYPPASGEDHYPDGAYDPTAETRFFTYPATVSTPGGGGNPSDGGPANKGAISNSAASLTFDGKISDWKDLQGFSRDPDDVSGALNPVDYRNAWMAHDGSSLWIAYQIDDAVMRSSNASLFNVYLDTDRNAATGYQSGMAIGTDYLLQGNSLYRYAGDGSSWNWQFETGVERRVSQFAAEHRIRLGSLGHPSSVDLLMIGDNLSNGGAFEDFYPDGVYDSQARKRFLSYSLDQQTASLSQTLGQPGQPELASAMPSVPRSKKKKRTARPYNGRLFQPAALLLPRQPAGLISD